MKSIVAKVSVILSIIFVVISICGISSVDCLKNYIPLKNAIIYNENIMYNIEISNIKGLPYKLVPFFYIALILIVLSSVMKFNKITKVKSIINIIISIVPALFILITHNYIWFLILINIYLLLFICIDFYTKNKTEIAINIITIIISALNFVQAVKHLNLEFNPSDIIIFGENLITISSNTLKIFSLWLIPYTILLIKEIATTHKTSRTIN